MIIVNGREDPHAAGRTLLDYCETAGYRLDRVAIEVNGHIVPKAQYPARDLSDGDRIEIVHFMGGG